MKKNHKYLKNKNLKCIDYIYIEGALHHCPNNNFLYNTLLERKKLYNGKACIYTDNRFNSYEGMNYYECTYLYDARKKADYSKKNKKQINSKFKNRCKKFDKLKISFKTAIRKIYKIKNIPEKTKIILGNYQVINNDYTFIYKSNSKNYIPNYKIDIEYYNSKFTDDQWANELIIELRNNGFLVFVLNNNPGLIFNENEGEIAFVYGFNKIIGFSTKNNNFKGYNNGCENILYDHYGFFDKWSKALTIPKNTPIKNIITKLKTETISNAYYNDIN